MGCNAVEPLEGRTLLSQSWFVSPGGSDLNPGTIALPFQTVQAAANVAQAGDFVEIRAGVYHEKVTPVNSGVPGAPITFEAYNNEKVTITGADAVTGWTVYSGSIYKTTSMTWDLLAGANQVYFDGIAGTEARWPNTSLTDVSHPATAAMTSVKIISPGHAIIYNSSLNQAAGYWVGATVHMGPGQDWSNETASITASAPGNITISYVPGDQYAIPKAGNRFYIWGTLKALDAGGEWYRDETTGVLYVKTPTGDSPLKHDIEAKQRIYAFDVSNVSDITIQGLIAFSCTVRTTSASNDIILNRDILRHLSETRLATDEYYVFPTDGVFMRGANCVVENCSIAYSSGDGIVFSGIGGTIENNVIHDVDLMGTNCAGIRALTANVVIDHNTIYNCGRHGIVADAVGDVVTYNVIHDIGLQTTEPGGIYTVSVSPAGGIIEHNIIYNIHTGGFGGTALFLDNSSSGWTVDHNITYNVDYAMKLNFTSNNDLLYNNNLGASIYSINTNQQGNWAGVQIYNNVFLKPIVVTPGAVLTHNATAATTDPTYGAGSFSAGAVGVSA